MRRSDFALAQKIQRDTVTALEVSIARHLNTTPDKLAFKVHSQNTVHEPLEPKGEKFKVSLTIEVHPRAGQPPIVIEDAAPSIVPEDGVVGVDVAAEGQDETIVARRDPTSGEIEVIRPPKKASRSKKATE